MVWVLAAIMTAAVIFAILRSMTRTIDVSKAAELDVDVYKDQLSALADDLDRGVLSPEEADAAKIEISRRLLAADIRVQSEHQVVKSTTSRVFMGAMAAVIGISAFGLYSFMGRPNLPDQPLTARIELAQQARLERPSQQQAENEAASPEISAAPEYLELIQQLRLAMETRSDDPQGWNLLALHEGRTGNFSAAWKAKDEAVVLLKDLATGQDYTELAEYMILAANGYVSVDAEGALANALRLDTKIPRARYYSGLALAQNGRPDVAYRMWLGLLEEGPEDAPWVQLIRSQIGSVARAAGINTVDQDAPGPTNDDIGAAQNMTAQDRNEMIAGMVTGLAERLESGGGTPQEWARLIRAYGVLGETGKAAAAWTKARDVFADESDALAVLLEAAQSAEVSN